MRTHLVLPGLEKAMLRAIVIFLASLLMLPYVSFSEWAIFGSDHEKLKGYTVVAVGEVSKRNHYDYEKSERLEWYEFEEAFGTKMCLKFTDYGPSLLGDEAALIVADESDNLKVVLIESSVGSIKISLETVTITPCLNRY